MPPSPLEVSHYGYGLETGQIILPDKIERAAPTEKVKTAYLGGG
jgi:ABC-type branched-subunit amino acid transport system ATPase component